MSQETLAEFRYNAQLGVFRVFRIHWDNSLPKDQMKITVQTCRGKLQGGPLALKELKGPRAVAWARDLESSWGGNEKFEHDLPHAVAKRKMEQWRRRCMELQLTEVLNIP